MRMRRCLVSAVVAACLVVPESSFAAKYAIIYSGSSSDSDAIILRNELDGYGWSRELFKTSFDPSKNPYHGHLTHGVNDDMVEAADDADLLYYSGHGGWQAELTLHQWSPYGPQHANSEDVSPDTACTNDAPWEVGIGWISEGVNESRWDSNIEWAVLAACVQLSTFPQNAFSGQSPAKTWARTLLGSPHRAHSIMGYTHYAPTNDDNVARYFARYSHQTRSVLDSWRTANNVYAPDYNWAYVSHYANRADYFPTLFPGPTPDTPANSSFRIDFLSKSGGSWARILDDNGNEEVIGYRSPLELWLASAASPLAAVLLEFPAPVTAIPGTVSTPHTVFEIDAVPHGKPLPPLRATVADASSAVRNMKGRDRRPVTPAAPGAQGVESERSGLNGHESVVFLENGVTMYSSERGLQHSPVAFSKDEAVRIVKQHLLDTGQLPADAVFVDVRPINMVSWTDMDANTLDDPQPIEYEVRFVQKVGDGFIDGAAAGLRVCIDNEGIREVYKKWFDVGETRGVADQLPDPAGPLVRALQEVEESSDLPDTARVTRMDVVYYPQIQDQDPLLVPSWRLEFDDGSCVHVNISTGELLSAGGSGR